MYRSAPPLPPLVVTAFGGYVVAVRTDDGTEAWRQRLGGAMVRLDVDADRVVAVVSGTIAVLDYATGEIRKKIAIAADPQTILVLGSRVFFSDNGALSCADLDLGVVLWRNELPGTGFGNPAIGVPGLTVQADRI